MIPTAAIIATAVHSAETSTEVRRSEPARLRDARSASTPSNFRKIRDDTRMFVVCTAVLIGVSLMYPAPDRKKLAGLTFATVDDKIDSAEVARPHLAKETRSEHLMNVAFTCTLLATVIGLWIYFR